MAKEHLNAFYISLEDNATGEHEDVVVNIFENIWKESLPLGLKGFLRNPSKVGMI